MFPLSTRFVSCTVYVDEQWDIDTTTATALMHGGAEITSFRSDYPWGHRTMTEIQATTRKQGINMFHDTIEEPRLATVIEVAVPAYSTIGYWTAVDDDGEIHTGYGDHRALRHIYDALEAGEEVQIDLDESF